MEVNHTMNLRNKKVSEEMMRKLRVNESRDHLPVVLALVLVAAQNRKTHQKLRGGPKTCGMVGAGVLVDGTTRIGMVHGMRQKKKWNGTSRPMFYRLPEEILGWLLLRRSGLPSSAKLAIHAATSNSMKFSDIERAMRQQEDELLHQERNKPSGNHQRSGRTYWVEQNDGDWC